MGFEHDAGTIVPCSYRVDPHDSRESERRPVAHCKAFSKAVGSDGSCMQRGNFWPAAHETFAVVAQDHKVFPEGQPISQDQGHAAMLSCLRHVKETVVPVRRPSVGGYLLSRNANDGSLPHGLGAVMSGRSAQGLWEGPHLMWHINCLEMLAVLIALKDFLPDLRDHHVLVRTDNTSVSVSYMNHQGGLQGGSSCGPRRNCSP